MKLYLWLAVLVVLGGAVALAMTLSPPPAAPLAEVAGVAEVTEVGEVAEVAAPSGVGIFPKALNK